jgi:hypothetical protein
MTPAKRWMQRVAAIGCVICLQLGYGFTPAEVHHVAEGSGLRSDFAVAPLCPEHHRGEAGLHGMGVKAFCSLYRIPGESEYGLLVLVNEQLARAA